MAKITRKAQSIFAYNAGVATNVVAQFGSLKAASPTYSQDPDIIQALAAWTGGLASAVVNNYSPAIQDLNALFFLFSRQIAYILQAGVPEWDATTPYYIGSFASDGVGGIYMSISDTNVNQAFSVTTKWTLYKSMSVVNVTDYYAVLPGDWFVIWTSDPKTDHSVITLPTPTTAMKGRELLIKVTGVTHEGYVSIDLEIVGHIDGTSGHIYINRWMTRRFICNGTTWLIAGGYYPNV